MSERSQERGGIAAPTATGEWCSTTQMTDCLHVGASVRDRTRRTTSANEIPMTVRVRLTLGWVSSLLTRSAASVWYYAADAGNRPLRLRFSRVQSSHVPRMGRPLRWRRQAAARRPGSRGWAVARAGEREHAMRQTDQLRLRAYQP